MQYSNDIMCDLVRTMTVSQDAKERISYRSAAMEAVKGENTETQAKLINAMYKEVMDKKNHVDTAVIAKSQGNVLKLQDIDTTTGCMNKITLLLGPYNTKSTKMMNDMYAFLIEARADFEYGYRFNNAIIRVFYENCVMVWYELIDINISLYTEMLRNPNSRAVKNKDNCTMVKTAENVLKFYRSGDWGKFVKAMKDPTVAAVGESAITMTYRAKAQNMNSSEIEMIDAVIENDTSKLYEPATEEIISTVMMVTVGVVMVFALLRVIVNYFFCLNAKAAMYLENQADFLAAAIEAEENLNNTDPKAIAKQKKALSIMTSIAEFIEAKILRNDVKAEKQLETDAKKYYPKSVVSTGPSGSDDFLIM